MMHKHGQVLAALVGGGLGAAGLGTLASQAHDDYESEKDRRNRIRDQAVVGALLGGGVGAGAHYMLPEGVKPPDKNPLTRFWERNNPVTNPGRLASTVAGGFAGLRIPHEVILGRGLGALGGKKTRVVSGLLRTAAGIAAARTIFGHAEEMLPSSR